MTHHKLGLDINTGHKIITQWQDSFKNLNTMTSVFSYNPKTGPMNTDVSVKLNMEVYLKQSRFQQQKTTVQQKMSVFGCLYFLGVQCLCNSVTAHARWGMPGRST